MYAPIGQTMMTNVGLNLKFCHFQGLFSPQQGAPFSPMKPDQIVMRPDAFIIKNTSVKII